jgi:hypothetical protein
VLTDLVGVEARLARHWRAVEPIQQLLLLLQGVRREHPVLHHEKQRGQQRERSDAPGNEAAAGSAGVAAADALHLGLLLLAVAYLHPSGHPK